MAHALVTVTLKVHDRASGQLERVADALGEYEWIEDMAAWFAMLDVARAGASCG